MSSLFTLNQAPSQLSLPSVPKMLNPGDSLLFIEDGVYCAVDKKLLALIPEGIKIFSLKEDLTARGIVSKVEPAVETVSYRGFVELSIAHAKVVSWF